MKFKIALISNYIVAALLFAFGLTYMFKLTFMPYHAEALEASWESIEASTQVLILALMRAVAGGFLASGLAIAILQFQFKKNPLAWIPITILSIGLAAATGSLYATYTVNTATEANAPFGLVVLCVALLLTAYILQRKK